MVFLWLKENMFRLRGLSRFYCLIPSATGLFFLFIYLIYISGQPDNSLNYDNVSRRNAVQMNENMNFGVIIDAGSSGSRIYVYTWPLHSGNSNELLNIMALRDSDGKAIVKKITPGLSTLKDSPSQAGTYIAPLLDFSLKYIPGKKVHETPLYIMATAGMRMIPEESQSAIMDELREYIKLNYRFQFHDSHVQVISGKQEGVYGWIATNYLLGRFNHDHNDAVPVVNIESSSKSGMDSAPHHRKRTVGVLDMGGGSMQIAFEIDKDTKLPSNLAAEFNLGCMDGDIDHTYRIYVTTFLGYGTNSARKNYERFLYQLTDRQQNLTSGTSSQPLTAISDPCLPVGLNVDTTIKFKSDVPSESATNTTIRKSPVSVQFQGTGEFQRCLSISNENLLGRDSPCQLKPCSIKGLHQPAIDFDNTEFYGFSEFWYTTDDILKAGGNYNFYKFFASARKFCSTSWLILSSQFNAGVFPKTNLPILKMQCFKSAWLASVLHDGFKFPRHYTKLTTVEEISGTEVQWSLGAMLYQTRYYPLREIQKKQFKVHRRVHRQYLNETYQYILLVLAIILVFCMLGQPHGLFVIKNCTFYRVVQPSITNYSIAGQKPALFDNSDVPSDKKHVPLSGVLTSTPGSSDSSSSFLHHSTSLNSLGPQRDQHLKPTSSYHRLSSLNNLQSGGFESVSLDISHTDYYDRFNKL